MKRKFLAVVLPIVGCATLVGSGFSAWYFGETANVPLNWQTNIDVSEEIKDDTGVLSIKKTTFDDNKNALFDSDYLVLDQGTVNTADPNYTKQGISFNASTDPDLVTNNAKVWEFTATYSNTKQGVKDLYDNGMKIVVDLKISVNSDLDKYLHVDTSKVVDVVSTVETSVFDEELKINAPTATGSDGFNVYTMKYEPKIQNSVDNSAEVEWTFTLNMGTTNKINNLFTYESTTGGEGVNETVAKPKTTQEFADMNAALDGKGAGALLKFDASIAIVERQ